MELVNTLWHLRNLKDTVIPHGFLKNKEYDLIRRYNYIEQLSREAVEILSDYIIVGKRIPETHDVPINAVQ